jgi:Nucleoside-diphosphate-sugar epimerases
MKILITGINGRIGHYVAIGLLKKGFDLIGLDRADDISTDLKDCSYVKADITDNNDLEKALNQYKFDAVIHLAALAHFSSNNIPIEDFMKINYEGAVNIAEAAYYCGAKKMLFSSTVEVYGETNKTVVDEDTPCNPITNYGKSKYEAERKLCSYLDSVGIEYYVYRFTPVYLPEFTKDLDKRVLLPKGLGAFYFKDGKHKFSLCSVNNIVDSVIAFVEGKVEPGIYIVSDKEVMSAKEIANVKKQNGEAKIVCKMPYSLLYAGINMASWVLEKLGKTEKGLLVTSLNKLAKPVCYDSSKIDKRVKLKWNIKNTLYSNKL